MENFTKKSDENLEETGEKLHRFVIESIKKGANKAEISQKLVEMKVNKSDAEKLVESIFNEVEEVVKQEQFTLRSIMPALVGGLIAAIMGGIIWGLIVIFTGYEIGFVAWGIGGLSGYAVVFLTRGKKGIPLQIVAVIFSVLGIIMGRYIFFYAILREELASKYGVEAVEGLSIFSSTLSQFFVESFFEFSSEYDFLWLVLAVITAWSIPKSSGIKLKEGGA